jgi:hypothetical protein
MGRKINFLGVVVEVLTNEEMGQAPKGTVYAMMRLDPERDRLSRHVMGAALLKRRLVVRCDDCRARCWFDPEGGWLNLPDGTDRLCMECMLARAKKEKNDQS